MRKLFILILTLCSVITAKAAPVDLKTACKTAEQVLGKQVSELLPRMQRAVGTSQQAPAYYLFNADDGNGFVLLSGDDRLTPLLGYSQEGHLAEMASLPEALKAYLNTYEQYVTAVRKGEATPTEDLTDVLAHRRAAGDAYLCASEWGQDKPYNALCPVLKEKTCPVGCVATALAQLLYYWKWPVQGTGYASGKDTDGEIHHGTLEHTYAWDAMRNTRAENLASEEASAAVAQLSYDCGLAVGMEWGIDGSGAGTPIKALYTNFGYIPTTLRTQMRNCFASDAEFLSVIADEIDAGRPVYQAASSTTGAGGDAAGHAYIIDGYNASGMVHVNWGWDGSANGYYDLSKMNPLNYSFTIEQRIITGIEPAMNGEKGEPTEYPYMGTAPKCDRKLGDKIRWKSVAFYVTAGNIWNNNGNTHTWTMAIGLFDAKNHLVGQVSTSRQTYTLELPPSTYYKEDAFQNIECKLTGTLANGDYAARVMFREGNGDWILPDMAGGQKNNAIYIKLDGNYITFTDGTDYLATSIALPQQEESSNAPVRYYDLQGREVVPGQTKGLVIERQGSRTRKIMRK